MSQQFHIFLQPELPEFKILCWSWIALGVLTFLFLMISGIRAPYGRHSSRRWGPGMDNRLGWFLMELPALIILPWLVFSKASPLNLHQYLMVGLFVFHYFNRVIIFPFRLRTKGKSIPLFIVLNAFVFNVVNGWLNGYFISMLYTPDNMPSYAIMAVGIFIFFTGLSINWTADNHLIGLRRKDLGYRIPQHPLFKYVSCPNHMGEIIEWTGFAILAWNLPAAAFAIWTFCNLVPRAVNHHHWYKEKFSEYPGERKAVLPFLL